MNNITVAGSLGKDAETRYLPNGDPVASFSVADSQGRDKPTIWWNCQLFGKRAESLAQYLTKGQAVAVSGNLTEREWTDKDGQKRKTMDLRVNDVALQGGKREAAAPAPARAPAPAGGFDDGMDVPF
jgi:single-strand DNA-binding protein